MAAQPVDAPVGSRDPVLKTYLYLRLAMVVLAVVLATSVVYQSVRAHVVLDSVSEYYYTPTRSALVACLVAIGVGLVALQGRTRIDDAALNLAGMFAPVVAFVPTRDGRPSDVSQQAVDAAVDNNLTALLVGAVVALGLLAWSGATRRGDRGSRPMRTGDRLGVLVGVLVVAAGVVWFTGWHHGFVTYAHDVAAVAMFAMIAVDVLVSSRSGHHRRSYAAIFAAMLLVQLTWLSTPFWDHAVLVVEAAMITLFAVFWTLQTWDLRYVDAAAAFRRTPTTPDDDHP